MQSNYDLFQKLNAEILYIAQLERDPSLLPRIKNFVQHAFPVVCDPNQISRTPLPLFTAYIIDKEGILRTRISGSLSARPHVDMILQELSKVEGVPRVHARSRNEESPIPQDPNRPVPAEEVLDVLWMWSHDRIGPGDTFKLAFLPTLAPGFHVYAPGEKRMTPFALELVLPPGIELAKPLQYPTPQTKRDPFLKLDVLQYEGDIPLAALVFQANKNLTLGNQTIKVTLSYQACNDTLCYPPTQKTIEMPIDVVSRETQRRQVAGWANW